MAPEPRANPVLFGHDGAAAALAAGARSGRLAHAWLVTGQPGVGKATLCWRFARWLLAGMPRDEGGETALHLPESDPVFRRVSASGHPDVLLLAPAQEAGKRRIIKVDEAREARRFLSLTAAEGGWRTVIMDEVEAMEAPAANTILKTLEEPPPRTVLLLVTAAPGRLLPTIRSRCRRLDLAPLEPDAMRKALSVLAPDADAAALIPLANGSPGRALALAEGEGVELARLARAALQALPQSGAAEAHALADRIAGRDAAGFAPFFDVLTRELQAALRDAARGRTAPPWLALRPLPAWVEAASSLRRQVEEAERLSLDRRQAVLVALDTLRRG
ncbi:DNA polymerase III subunit delta' [Sabulicella glaciei]|uniref:DNA polymerase III subunit delta n=1 Tax=Sabulicella glaciei TaxID=2984948 RepID=A0ABT3NSU3_9PROT|nr:DNA polymerase III subunit delta' [Roseococcus sp. MDT2-1-1]MCW8084624.1 DNA polymerase III subunit delta' [Roseococcus sp. MDT2-1-1]